MNIGKWIQRLSPADGPPPQTLSAFMRWCVVGGVACDVAGGRIFWLLAGTIEAGTALILGR